MNALRGERLSVLHFAAHGNFVHRTPPLSKLYLEGEEFVTAAEIRGESKSALERGLVMLNVCEGGAAAGQLGGVVVGLAESFLEHGAAAVIAPLWSVPDDEALEMTQRCLPRMLKGDVIASVLRDARHGDAPSIHPLAYLLWGDVMAAFR
jgi:CHAT domain-containing protein